MIFLGTVLAICCLQAAKAAPSHWGSSNQQLEGVPDLETFSKISYPKYDILDLGEYSKDHLPGDEIKITKESKITIPQPYPVKIPIPQPYPVHIPKPYPVHETKYVKVPVHIPQIIEKKVPYPVEVLKPYPVHTHSEGGDQGGGQEQHGGAHYEHLEDGGGLEQHLGGEGGGYGGGIGLLGHQAVEGNGYGVQEEHAQLPSDEGFEHGIGGGNLNPYEAKSLEEGGSAPSAESGGWQPIGGQEGDEQYN